MSWQVYNAGLITAYDIDGWGCGFALMRVKTGSRYFPHPHPVLHFPKEEPMMAVRLSTARWGGI
jgi:hypothetical protein